MQVLAESAAADEPEEEDDEAEEPAPKQRRGFALPGKVSGRSVREDDSGLAEGDERGEQKAIEQAKKARGGSFMRAAGDTAADTYQEVRQSCCALSLCLQPQLLGARGAEKLQGGTWHVLTVS